MLINHIARGVLVATGGRAHIFQGCFICLFIHINLFIDIKHEQDVHGSSDEFDANVNYILLDKMSCDLSVKQTTLVVIIQVCRVFEMPLVIHHVDLFGLALHLSKFAEIVHALAK